MLKSQYLSKLNRQAGNSPVLTVHAKGDQIYQCSLNGGIYSWQLQAPDARLFDEQGQIVGNHYSGPIWEYKEGSRVVGQVLNKIDIDAGFLYFLVACQGNSA